MISAYEGGLQEKRTDAVKSSDAAGTKHNGELQARWVRDANL